MTKCKKTIFGFIGLYLFAVLSLAQAQNTPEAQGAAPQWHAGQRIEEIYSQLNLTDAQKKQLEDNKQRLRVRMESIRQTMKTDRKALQDELMSPQLDMPKINGLHDQIKTLVSQMEDIRLSSILAVRTILTPEQFSKFITLIHKHKQEHQKEGLRTGK